RRARFGTAGGLGWRRPEVEGGPPDRPVHEEVKEGQERPLEDGQRERRHGSAPPELQDGPSDRDAVTLLERVLSDRRLVHLRPVRRTQVRDRSEERRVGKEWRSR